MTKSKAQIERERIEKVTTGWVNKFYEGCQMMDRLSAAMEAFNGLKREDNNKKTK